MPPSAERHRDDSSDAPARTGPRRGGGGEADRLRAELDRLRAELTDRTRELQQSDARFRSIIERTADGIVILSSEGTVLFVNPAAERLFGRDAASLRGGPFGFPIVSGETTEIDIVRSGNDDGDESIIAELRAADTVWEGQAARLIALRDVTDRKRAAEREQRLVMERAARQQAEAAEQRASFLARMATVLDRSLDYQTTLNSVAKLLVPHPADWVVIDLLEGDELVRLAMADSDASKTPLLEELRERFPPRPGSLHPTSRVVESREPLLVEDVGDVDEWVASAEHAALLRRIGIRSLIALPLVSRGGTLGAMTLVRRDRPFGRADFSLAREVAQRAAQAVDNARLYRAAVVANQAKSDFLAVISHELRTPLNAIMGYAEILLSGIAGEMDGQHKDKISRINASARHLLQIIEEILSFARMEAGREHIRPEPITLAALMKDAIAVAEPLARDKDLRFETEIADPDAPLFLDPGKVRQVALNLLSNAVKFTDKGSVGLRAWVENDELGLEVSDTGVGIAPEHRSSIFEAFWQVESTSTRRSGGTGLGLSVSQRLAKALGGRIEVRSQVGRGSTFTLHLPTRYQGDGEPIDATDDIGSPAPAHGPSAVDPSDVPR